jgi:hypothetical protein
VLPKETASVSDASGESSCVKHNLTASNKKMNGTSVNAVNKVGDNNFCKNEGNFTHDRNIVISITCFVPLYRKL